MKSKNLSDSRIHDIALSLITTSEPVEPIDCVYSGDALVSKIDNIIQVWRLEIERTALEVSTEEVDESGKELHDAALKLIESKDLDYIIVGDKFLSKLAWETLDADISVWCLESTQTVDQVKALCKDHKHCEYCGVSRDNLNAELCDFCVEWNKLERRVSKICDACGTRSKLPFDVLKSIGCSKCGSKEDIGLDI